MIPITTLAVAGYRSLREIRLSTGTLTLVTGPNGSGKSSLYRAVRLLAEVAQGRTIGSLAAEGGFGSALWAGPETPSRAMQQGAVLVQGTVRRNPVSLRLGVSTAHQGYAIDLGLPPPMPPSRFNRDPEIKREALWTGRTWRRGACFAERVGPAVRIRDRNGVWQEAESGLASFDSMLTHSAGPGDTADLLSFRESLRAWRFYDHFRTDAASPARRRPVGTRTPALASDGADLAPAIATIPEVGEEDVLAETVDDAFSGARIDVRQEEGMFDLLMVQHGLPRPLRAAELSDGTLRYLLLTAALLTPRPPPLMAFNEPETSLHPSLLAPLARLLRRAARRSQVLVVSHAEALVSALSEGEAKLIRLSRQLGETVAEDGDQPAWTWPSR